mmetsp:Transcript_41422/g.119871  ORF Transcript_41422/g.119871 Transcript_41422/m.119871 type:complete len:91 (+) Transcript_41422:62-334(+)
MGRGCSWSTETCEAVAFAVADNLQPRRISQDFGLNYESSRVFHSTAELKCGITDAIRILNTEADRVAKAVREFPERLRLLIQSEGGHFEH